MKMETRKRFGQAWTEQEDIDLEHELKLGMEISNIAQKHKRSDRAIRLRFGGLIRKMLHQNKTKSYIASYFSVSSEYIDGILDECKETPTKLGMIENEIAEMKRKMTKLENAMLKLYKKLKTDKTK